VELWEEKQLEASAKLDKAKEILASDAEDRIEKAKPFIEQAKALKAEAAQLEEIKTLGQEFEEAKSKAEKQEDKARTAPKQYKSFGEWLISVAAAGDQRKGFRTDPRLLGYRLDDEDDMAAPGWTVGPGDTKATMVENVGARGGFLVPTEFRAELLGDEYERNFVRQRATIIPMRRRQVNIPTLDQTGTTANVPHQYGGMYATWTEEQGLKTQVDPTFRKVELVAHKLVCYTRASDELLADSAISLEGFLRGPMGFPGVIRWQEEWAFLQGTGAGMPLGIINAGCTITVARAADGTVGIADLANMMHHFQGDNPVWHIARCQYANLLQMSGPSGNASYVFMPSARDSVPATLFGYPIIWTEKVPAAGETGDVCLCDWSRYLIGDRESISIASTNMGARFQYDETEWRAVHRVDGQPWLSTPWTLADGTHTISPFVILGGKSAT